MSGNSIAQPEKAIL